MPPDDMARFGCWKRLARCAKPLTHRTLASMLGCAVVVACGQSGDPALQAAARVNRQAITVHQINVLQQQLGLKPEQSGNEVLERLIEQELASQKAQDLGLDREARVVQQMEVARRQVMARAYIDRLNETVPRPSTGAVDMYYDDKPELFKARRVFTLQELAIEAKPHQIEILRSQLQSSATVSDFMDLLRANGVRFTDTQVVRSAEQLPLKLLESIARMKDGHSLMTPTPVGVQVIALVASRAEPVDRDRARPVIEKFLHNEARRKRVDADIKALRAQARVQYEGAFAAASAASGAEPGLSNAPTATSRAPAASGVGEPDTDKAIRLK